MTFDLLLEPSVGVHGVDGVMGPDQVVLVSGFHMSTGPVLPRTRTHGMFSSIGRRCWILTRQSDLPTHMARQTRFAYLAVGQVFSQPPAWTGKSSRRYPDA